ncbi:hypothetical protein KI387_029309, partial [Taxus chinensis]
MMKIKMIDSYISMTPNRQMTNMNLLETRFGQVNTPSLLFLPKNLFVQFHRLAYIYFLVIAALNQLPQLAVFGRTVSLFPLLFILCVTAIKDGYEDWRRHHYDKKENNRETINLDGESNLKTRYAIPETAAKRPKREPPSGLIRCEQPNRNIYGFIANMEIDGRRIPLGPSNIVLRGCQLKNTTWVVGVVAYAGQETKAMLNSSAAKVLWQIEKADFNENSSLKFLKIEQGMNGSSSMRGNFGGNLAPENRKQYFNTSDRMEMPCGFVNYPSPGFRVSAADREAMESCRGLVLISAIFGGYDRLRQPKRVRRITVEKVCFFMFVDNPSLEKLTGYGIEPDESQKIGLWRIVLVEDLPYEEHVMNGLIPKYLPHRLFPNCMYTIWIDAKIQLAVDPLLMLENLLIKQNAKIALSRHPYNVHTMEEAIFTVRWRKWNKEAVRLQMEDYCAQGLQPWSSKKLPYITDVGDTALILRKQSIPAKVFSCLVFNEIQDPEGILGPPRGGHIARRETEQREHLLRHDLHRRRAARQGRVVPETVADLVEFLLETEAQEIEYEIARCRPT